MKDQLLKIGKYCLFTVAVLASIAILVFVYLKILNPYLNFNGFWGVDQAQYHYYVKYYLSFPHFPINGWDYFWRNGVPREIDLTWIHFILTAALARSIGFYQAVKIYPLIFLGLVILFSYLLFLTISKNIFVSLGLTISLMMGSAIYTDLISAGVVLSSLSHAFLPLALLFLVLFYKKADKKFLVAASIACALGILSHGLMGVFWIFIPCFIFILFLTRSWRKPIDMQSLIAAVQFTIVTFAVGAVASWPHILQGVSGGSNSIVLEKALAGKIENVFGILWQSNHIGLVYAFGLSLIVALVFWIFKKAPPSRLLGSYFAVMAYLLVWLWTYQLGINPLSSTIFPGRILWIWGILLAAMSATLVRPLSDISGQKITLRIMQLIGFGIVSILILGVCIYPIKGKFINLELVSEGAAVWNAGLTDPFKNFVDQKNTNVRLWTHMGLYNLIWKFASDIPLSEGYAQIATKYSRLWEGWLFAVLSEPNWNTQEIPRDLVKNQAKFFIDWYAIKYLLGVSTFGEYTVSPYFSEFGADGCVEDKLAINDPDRTAIYRISDLCTSGIVTPVNSFVVGFVGGNEGYSNFIKSIANLNLGPSYLVPVRISESIGGIAARKLTYLDALVIYEPKTKGILAGNGWNNVYNFANAGGKVWIETGGNSQNREGSSLPSIFPIKALSYGELGKQWQPGGPLGTVTDFTQLGDLTYNQTPWKLSYGEETQLKSNTTTLLSQGGKAIAVSRNLGRGKVLWTGFNIFYRPEYFRRQTTALAEANFVDVFIKEIFGELPRTTAAARVVRPSPENIKISGQDFSGVLIKETNWPGWHAGISVNGKSQSLPVLTAGPELMYIPIPKKFTSQVITVSANYDGAFIYWLSFFVSVVSLIGAVCYLLFGSKMLKILKK